jgi:hypothetical protein
LSVLVSLVSENEVQGTVIVLEKFCSFFLIPPPPHPSSFPRKSVANIDSNSLTSLFLKDAAF